MKRNLFILLLLIISSVTLAQNGLEGIIVEKYYVSNAADAAGSIGALPVGSVTYRIYADMLPGYKFQAAYGVPGHELRIATTTAFFNNEDRGAVAPTYNKTFAADNTVMLDSWLSVGAGCAANFGIMKSEDNVAGGGATVVNNNGILQNNDPSAGIPLTTQDGLYAGVIQSVTFVGINSGVANELDVFDNISNAGSLFKTSNGSWASLTGSTGPIPATNRVLIAQVTTNGCLTFELNIQIGTPTGGAENYVARNPAGNEIQIPSLIYNIPAVAIVPSPSTTICSGTNVTFTATPINGGPAPVYQWKKNGTVVGTNSPTYSNNALSNGAQIKCTLTSNAGGCVSSGAVTSNLINMVVNPLPSATITPAGPTTFCSGTNALTLNANTGAGLTYKWKKGSGYVNGATGSSYVPTSSATYKVEVTGTGGCVKTSSGVVVTVNPLPTATITPAGPTTYCSGTNPLTLTANAGTLTYQWLKNNVAISGATNINYVPTATSTATYKVTVTNTNGCTKSSTGIAVTVKSLPSATITAQGPTTFCAGDSVVLTANSGTGLTYQWKKGSNNVSGATGINYTAKTAGTYKVTVTNSNGCSKVSSGKVVTVNCREGESITDNTSVTPQIYPNPANGPFTINLTDNNTENGTATIELVNALGQVVYLTKSNFSDGLLSQEMNAGQNLPKGLYLIRIILNDHIYNSRVIIQ